MMPDWVGHYIGIPYLERGRDRRGYDCWGLASAVWREIFALDVPSYDERYACAEDAAEIGRLIRGDLPASPWREVPLKEARAGDGILLRIKGEPCHVGVIVEPPYFLHIHRGTGAGLERVDSLLWSRRVLGVFRHEALCEQPAPMGVKA